MAVPVLMSETADRQLGVWFPAIRTGTGTDVFTRRLCDGLNARGVRAHITWLPPRAEYLPHTVTVPDPPAWASVAHVNTWLHSRFLPETLPVVATVHHAIHDPDLRRYKGFLQGMYHRRWIVPIESRVMRRADQVVAVSGFAAQMARQTLHDANIKVVHNGVDVSHAADDRRGLVQHQPFRLLYVGAWRKMKGVDLLAPIMRELGDRFLLRYTGGPSARKSRAVMPSNTIDIGRLSGEQVKAAMTDADALLLPSRSEGFGLVAIEAMSCGLPVIAGDGTSLTELIVDGRTGILCARDDVTGFVSAVRRLADSAQLASSIASAAREVALSRFGLKSMVDAYVAIYRDVIRKER